EKISSFMKSLKIARTALGKISILLLLIVSVGLQLSAQNLPEAPNRLVSDYAGVLNRGELQALEDKLLAFEDTTSNQIAVVLVNSTEGYDVADYAVRLGKKWGVGGKKYNNGVILLAAINDRAVTIQTGYGMEGALPDIIAYRIIQNEIKPHFTRQEIGRASCRERDEIRREGV